MKKIIIIKLLIVCLFVFNLMNLGTCKKRIKYTNLPGQPPNIHHVVKEKEKGKFECDGNLPEEEKKKCQTAEIIKVPLRSQECPKNHKKDAKGRCRPSWN